MRQIFTKLTAIAEDVYMQLGLLIQKRIIFFSFGFVEIPNPTEELPVEFLRTIRPHIRTACSPKANQPLQPAPDAYQSIIIQIQDCIAFFQPFFQRSVKVTIHDPLWLIQQSFQLLIKFLLG